ncbi:MAG: type II secretion system protein M [Kangiellaceae bacterium]|nr:type II secretion system protein M [Kangiellaceae bacterium]
MSGIKTWFAGLNQREKSMVTILGFMLVLLILFIAVVMPIKKYMTVLNTDVKSYAADLPIVQQKVAAIKARGVSTSTGNNLPLNQLVTQTAQSFGLKFSRIEEKKRNQEIQLRLDDVEFDQLLRWIAMLEQSRGLIVDTLRVSDTDTTGMVDASLKISKS